MLKTSGSPAQKAAQLQQAMPETSSTSSGTLVERSGADGKRPAAPPVKGPGNAESVRQALIAVYIDISAPLYEKCLATTAALVAVVAEKQ